MFIISLGCFQDVIKETKFEKKYGVDVVRNLETGKVETLKKKDKDDVDEMLKEEGWYLYFDVYLR